MSELSDRIEGSLLAAACGDALGLPFEGHRSVDAQRLESWCTEDRPLVYSDDTAMMRVLARHLGENDGRLDEERLIIEFAHDWWADPGRGYGASPPQIFRAALAGRDWRAVARDLFGGAGSLGNGGAMRVAPVAHLPVPITDRAALARRQAALTHLHPEALDGAAVLCAAIGTAASAAGEVAPEAFLSGLTPHITTAAFSERIGQVGALVERRPAPARIGEELGHEITARGSVPTAIAAFLLHPDDPEAALVEAIRIGGDTDTIATMTGALAGARCGALALPERWVARLEAAPELHRHAHRLAALHPHP